MHARGCNRSFRRIRRMLLTTRNLRGPEIGAHSLAGEPVGPLAGLVARWAPDRPRSLTHSHATSRLDEVSSRRRRILHRLLVRGSPAVARPARDLTPQRRLIICMAASFSAGRAAVVAGYLDFGAPRS